MPELGPSGSVRGAVSNHRSYRDHRLSVPRPGETPDSGQPFDPIFGPLAGLGFLTSPPVPWVVPASSNASPAAQQRIPGLGETSSLVTVVFPLSIGVQHWPSVGYLRLCRGSSSFPLWASVRRIWMS